MENKPTTCSWVPLLGEFEQSEGGLTFKGGEHEPPAAADVPVQEAADSPPTPRPKNVFVGQALCNQRFTEGRIKAEIEFEEVDFRCMADLILQYDPSSEEMLNVSLGGGPNFISFRWWTAAHSEASQPTRQATKKWKFIRTGGDRVNLKAGRKYDIEIIVQGSSATLILDGVEIAREILPFQLSGLQLGVFCAGPKRIYFRNFRVESKRPQAFVVMQFNTPEYEALFNDVILPVCEEMGLKAYRADFTYMPGLVVSDITRQIAESRVIIAEVTPVNGNVYYEVGYADALKKPVILITAAEQLPFGVRPYRTVFYQNSIAGKNQVESILKKYLKNIMSPQSMPE